MFWLPSCVGSTVRSSQGRVTAVVDLPGASAEQNRSIREPWADRHHLFFLACAYGGSWSVWILAWLVARSTGLGDLLFNERLVWAALFERGLAGPLFAVSALAVIGVYGPMVAGVLATRADAATDLYVLGARITKIAVGARWYVRLALILSAVAVLPGVLLVAVTGVAADRPTAARLVLFLVVFFVFQVLTSGTEEVGWRGYLLEKLLPGRNLWDAGWAVGVPWALWHLPIVIMLFVQQGMPPAAIIGSLFGFGIGIVAMSILHAWFYANTRSVFLAIVIHATFNTVPLSTGLLLDESHLAAVLPQLLLWAVVLIIVKQSERAASPPTDT